MVKLQYLLIFGIMVVSEIYTSSIVILLPSYAGQPPIAEHCTNAAEYVECVEEFFKEEENRNLTGDYQNRLKTTFIVYSTTESIRIIAGFFVVFYLAGEKFRKIIFRVDGVALTGFATCIAYGSLVFGSWRNYGLENETLKGWAIVMYTFLIISQVCQIRAMVEYFPWNATLFHIYKGVRVIAVALYLFIEAYSEYLELKTTIVFIVVTLEYLHALFEFVHEGFEKWEENEEQKSDDRYHAFHDVEAKK